MRVKGKGLLAFTLCVGLLFTGCGQNSVSGSSSYTHAAQGSGVQTSADEVDVDINLTNMSITMQYATLGNMYDNPDKNLGRTVRMRGLFYTSENEDTGVRYYFVGVPDETMCCQEVMEFLWEGHTYPADYPQENAEVEIIGTFTSYIEDGYTFFCMTITELIVL